MQEIAKQLADLMQRLSLQPAGANNFFGKVLGFPLGVQVVLNSETTGLIFHVRHPFKTSNSPGPYTPDGCLAELILNRKADFDLDDRIAWLSFFDCAALLQEDKVYPLLTETLSGMKKAGFCPDGDLCHECQKESVAELKFDDGRVTQICQTCQRQEAQAVALHPHNVPFIVGYGLVSALFAAISWAGAWSLYDWCFSLFHSKTIYLPTMGLAVTYVGIGFATAFPSSFILKKIPRRGDKIAGWIGGAFVLIAVLVGELLYVAWMIYREVDVFNFKVAFTLLPSIVGHYPTTFALGKVGAAAIAVYFAYDAVRPKKPRKT